MNRYLIKSDTETFEDNFIKGEGKFAICYDLEGKIEAETPRDAVLKFIASELYFTDGTLDKDEDIEEEAKKCIAHELTMIAQNLVKCKLRRGSVGKLFYIILIHDLGFSN